MSVALSNGASVVAFIGLSGEALRGILFIYDIVEDIKDAPGHLRALYQDLTFFQLSLATFQETTTNAARLGAILGLSTTQVLDDAANAIKPILLVFQEYGQGQATPIRKRIRIALKKHKLLKYSERLVKSSSLIIATNANISMLNITFEQQNSSGNNSVISVDFVKDITEKFAALERALQSTITYVLNTFMEISAKVNGLPDALGRRIESRFAELPVISETARKTFLVVQSSFQDTPSLSDQLSIEVRRVVRDIVQRAIFEAADKQIAVSDIEAVMRRVLLEHDLHIISRNGSSISGSGETPKQSESLLQLEQSQSGIRRRKRFFQHRQDGVKDDREPSLTNHNQGAEQDTKKTSKVLSLLVQIFRHLDSRKFYLAFEIVRDITIGIAVMRCPHAKTLVILGFLADCYKALCARLAAPANEDCQVTMPQQQLCVNIVFPSGQNQIELFRLDVTSLQNDTQFFLTLKRFYEKKLYGKNPWKQYLFSNRVLEIRLVEFEIHHSSGAVSLRRTDTLPPSTHSAYRYRLPPESSPPSSFNFLHVFFRSAFFKNENRKIWLDGIPKCTSRGPQLDQMNCSEQIGWGLEIVEAWSREKIIDSVHNYISIPVVLIGFLAMLYNYKLRGSLLWRWWWSLMSLLFLWSGLTELRVLRFRRHQKVFEYDLVFGELVWMRI